MLCGELRIFTTYGGKCRLIPLAGSGDPLPGERHDSTGGVLRIGAHPPNAAIAELRERRTSLERGERRLKRFRMIAGDLPPVIPLARRHSSLPNERIDFGDVGRVGRTLLFLLKPGAHLLNQPILILQTSRHLPKLWRASEIYHRL